MTGWANAFTAPETERVGFAVEVQDGSETSIFMASFSSRDPGGGAQL